MRKLNNKGFTLVEIVIVIVIIAILAAMLVPALTQWIDKSKMKTFTSACGTIKTSVASCISEEYATNSQVNSLTGITDAATRIGNDIGKQVETVAKATVQAGTISNDKDFAVNSDATANSMVITDGKFIGSWDGNSWAVSKKS